MDLIQQYRAYYTLYPMEFPILHLFGHRPVANKLFWVWSNIQLLRYLLWTALNQFHEPKNYQSEGLQPSAVPPNVSEIYVKSKGLSQMRWESEM